MLRTSQENNLELNLLKRGSKEFSMARTEVRDESILEREHCHVNFTPEIPLISSI